LSVWARAPASRAGTTSFQPLPASPRCATKIDPRVQPGLQTPPPSPTPTSHTCGHARRLGRGAAAVPGLAGVLHRPGLRPGQPAPLHRAPLGRHRRRTSRPTHGRQVGGACTTGKGGVYRDASTYGCVPWRARAAASCVWGPWRRAAPPRSNARLGESSRFTGTCMGKCEKLLLDEWRGR
jgi:hypothetical protein